MVIRSIPIFNFIHLSKRLPESPLLLSDPYTLPNFSSPLSITISHLHSESWSTSLRHSSPSLAIITQHCPKGLQQPCPAAALLVDSKAFPTSQTVHPDILGDRTVTWEGHCCIRDVPRLQQLEICKDFILSKCQLTKN